MDLGKFDLVLDVTRHCPLMPNVSTLENLEQAILSSPASLHELGTGLPFNSMVNGSEDLVTKQN